MTRSKFVCGILSAADPKSGKSSCDLLQKALPSVPGAGRSAAFGPTAGSAPARQVETVDRSLGGILEVHK